MTKNEALAAQEQATDATPLRRDDLTVEELDGEAILYDPRYGAIHRFNAMTFFVWDLCDGSNTPADIAQRLTKLCEVEPDEALNSVQRVIAELSILELVEGAPVEPISESNVPWWTAAPLEPLASSSPPTVDRPGPLRLSRRELLRGGVTKLVFVAPVISTFFAAGAYASGLSASAAFGPGGCKEAGYSCTVNGDCCDNECTAGICQVDPACQGVGEICFTDEDCCSDDCDQGVCQ